MSIRSGANIANTDSIDGLKPRSNAELLLPNTLILKRYQPFFTFFSRDVIWIRIVIKKSSFFQKKGHYHNF
jgi:hypothetical protein